MSVYRIYENLKVDLALFMHPSDLIKTFLIFIYPHEHRTSPCCHCIRRDSICIEHASYRKILKHKISKKSLMNGGASSQNAKILTFNVA